MELDEEIFEKYASKSSKVFDLTKFKKFQPQLFNAIMRAMAACQTKREN